MAHSFKIEKDVKQFKVTFQKKSDLKAIRQLEFSSRLLNSLVPDQNNVWRTGRRSNYYIMGFPPIITWRCESEYLLVGTASNDSKIDKSYIDELTIAIEGLCEHSSDEGAKYRFKITNGKDTQNYEFHSRARTICALTVLYDLEWHPRKDLEIWINPDLTDKLPPGEVPDQAREVEQYYGDPSKTADVLRNEGWAREAEVPSMYVEARQVGRQSQQHYKITQVAQPLHNQVKRTDIKPRWRNALFAAQKFTCQICLTNYASSKDQLSPDHRVPVVFETDNLNDSNFMSKLMTLCRYCNQAKREFTKRLDFDYDWDSSPWAYPDKYRMEIAIQQLNSLAETSGVTIPELLGQLNEKLGLDS
jgi:5-methylcytosine-specific restriction endonuclease McrA